MVAPDLLKFSTPSTQAEVIKEVPMRKYFLLVLLIIAVSGCSHSPAPLKIMGSPSMPILPSASDVINDSATVAGATVADALDTVAAAGGGDVVGPAGAVDAQIATFDGVTGKLLQDSGSSIADFEVASENVIIVSPSGGDYTLLSAAVAYVTTQTPSSSNRFVIKVGPGVYTETTTMVLDDYVNIIGNNRITTKIVMSTDGSDLFTFSGPGPCGVSGLAFVGTDTNTSSCFLITAGALSLYDCTISDFDYGVEVTGGAGSCNNVNTSRNSDMSKMFYGNGGKFVHGKLWA